MSAYAGVYNQDLNKSQDASLHIDNMILYLTGAFVNLVIHFSTTMFVHDEPGFFVGYNNPASIMVIISNVFIGLAITAVYKCGSLKPSWTTHDELLSLGRRQCHHQMFRHSVCHRHSSLSVSDPFWHLVVLSSTSWNNDRLHFCVAVRRSSSTEELRSA